MSFTHNTLLNLFFSIHLIFFQYILPSIWCVFVNPNILLVLYYLILNPFFLLTNFFCTLFCSNIKECFFPSQFCIEIQISILSQFYCCCSTCNLCISSYIALLFSTSYSKMPIFTLLVYAGIIKYSYFIFAKSLFL